jgi:hypothetical protein
MEVLFLMKSIERKENSVLKEKIDSHIVWKPAHMCSISPVIWKYKLK